MTGSTEVGQRVIRNSAVNIKRLALELGSKAPNIIFADADLEAAARGAFKAAFGNTGQSCVAGSRLYIQRPVYDRVMERVMQLAGAARIGPAMDLATELGPVVDQRQYETIMAYIESGKASGATRPGAGPPARPDLPAGGYYCRLPSLPEWRTMLASRMRRFSGRCCASSVRRRAGTRRSRQRHHLWTGCGLVTRDVGRAHRVAAQLKAGVVWVNTYDLFSANVPFGGFKQSGYGRDNGQSAVECSPK